ncbi:MAG: carboxypeptidase-like regulatory domain-containing protein [Hyphomonadaceae bacterium]
MTSFRKHLSVFMALIVIVLGSLVAPTQTAYAQLGTRVLNTANVTFDQGDTQLSISTNTAEFVIEAARTPSTIEFFRFAPSAPDAITTMINGSNFSPDGTLSGAFQNIGPPVTANGLLLDLSGNVPLTPAERYLAGELFFVRVTDLGQNGDPDTIETVVITVAADSGDSIVLQLFESGPDTGEFFAYIPSSRDETPPNDAVLSVPDMENLTATYVDTFDATEVSVDTAIIEPFGRVFDSATGAPIDGAQITIIDAATGLPAGVYGVDGESGFPSTIISGETASDDSGLDYPLAPGEFLFPVLLPGTYQLRVDPPAGFVFASSFDESFFDTVAGGPFTIINGSFGASFTQTAFGPLNFDIPLDGTGELTVLKEANVQVAAAGDSVGYTVQIENREPAPLFLRVRDILPRGFRYREGTARLDGVPLADPEISADGSTLDFTGDVILSGQTQNLTYIALATAGVRTGEAVNQAFAVNQSGLPISNRAEAAVTIREDLLRSQLTIIGRVAENACAPDADWVRETNDGVGVANVRLYLETGDYVVTDQDGLYHFEGVDPGTHVVQIDTETLPAGYNAVVCEENSRYAGSAISKFVDATGGTIWRANFYLEQDGSVQVEDTEAVFDDNTDYLNYDQSWIDAQTADVEWVYPDSTLTPSSRSINIGIKHAAFDRVTLELNGERVKGLNFAGTENSADGTVEISRWRGVDIAAGRNEFTATVTDQHGAVKTVLKRDIWFIAEVERATLVDDQSILVADGRTNPSIAVRLTNGAGRPVHAGREVHVTVAAPYTLNNTNLFEESAPIVAEFSNLTTVTVGPNGIAMVELTPTLETGRARVSLTLDSGRNEDVDVYLQPEKRDWILVGLAEGSIGLERLDGPGAIDANDLLNEGRIAFFAKGVIKGDWLLTLAVDTAKRRGDADSDLFGGEIDPNAFYTLYGDRTFQNKEAESRYPVYVKLERNTFQALFGDFDTNLSDTDLGRYNRRLSGFKTVYEGENLAFSAFAAETNQGFNRQEIAADGTSGPYILENAPLIRNSERIFVETRDRFRPNIIVDELPLTRFVDYDIDFDTGELIFRRPVNATDAGFNPNVIVAEFETSAAVERNVTAGGRVAARAFDGRVEVGATYIREEGDDSIADAVSQLAGVDLTARIDQYTEVHAEYARTSRDSAAEANSGETDADAFLVEVIRRQEALTVTGYYREDEAGFGLGQQSSATVGIRRYGAAVSAELGRAKNTAAQNGASHFVDAEAYREESLENGNSRTVAEAALRRESPLFGASVGLRSVSENLDADNNGPRRSHLLTSSLRKTFENIGLTLSAAHEQPLGGDSDESTLFPQRTILGADKTLGNRATLNLRHEILDGENASGQNTTVGVTVQPWSGGQVSATTDFITQDSARRLSATVGVDQTLRLSDNWTAGLGVARRARISGGDFVLDVVPDDALSPLETAPVSLLTQDQSFTSAYAGLGYQNEKSAGSTRFEVRDSAIGTRYSAVFGGAREATEDLSFALAGRVEQNLGDETANTLSVDARFGAAWRPRGKGAVVFNRFDASYENVTGQSSTWKLVNNFGINAVLAERFQVAGFYGFKYSESDFFGDSFSEVTQLVGGELRYDVTKRVDVGLSGSALISQNGQTDFQIGPSVGYSPVENTWISLGWNIDGFRDDDFEAAEFTRDGPFIKLRVKFDQHSVRNLLDRVSPRGR